MLGMLGSRLGAGDGIAVAVSGLRVGIVIVWGLWVAWVII